MPMSDDITSRMTPARAFEINSLIVGAWMVREGLSDNDVPDLSSASLADVIEASQIVADTPPEPREGGGVTLTCHVALTRIPQLYAWAVATTSLARICKEHADGNQSD
jgi:hypothetical protein